MKCQEYVKIPVYYRNYVRCNQILFNGFISIIPIQNLLSRFTFFVIIKVETSFVSKYNQFLPLMLLKYALI